MHEPTNRTKGRTGTFAADEPRRGAVSPQVLRATLALRELILTEEWPSGRRLSEPQLVRRVGVSRTPLRLALELLQHEGLVERRRQGGFAVRSFSLADIEEAVMLRGILEGTVARLAAENQAQRTDLTEMERALYEMDGLLKKDHTVDILTRYVAANERFHSALLELVDAPARETFDAPGELRAVRLAKCVFPGSRRHA